MKVTKITVSVDAKRSEQFQSAGSGIAVEIELEEGDDKIEAIEKAQKLLQPHADRIADEMLRQVLYTQQNGLPERADRGQGGRGGAGGNYGGRGGGGNYRNNFPSPPADARPQQPSRRNPDFGPDDDTGGYGR